jgi:hypothetical protein
MPEQDPHSAQPAPEGVVYSCAGSFYLEEALRSARSSLRHNAVPHLLFSSEEPAREPGLRFERFEPSSNPYVDKIANMRRSPFVRSIYLDTDTYVVDEIVHLLALLDRYDIAVAYAPGHRGFADPRVPVAFYEFNTGVVAWRASDRMEAFMRSWQDTYLAWLEDEPFAGASKPNERRLARRALLGRSLSRGGTADQPAFRRCAWEHDVRLFVLAPEYNLRLGQPTTVVEKVRVIHGRHRDFEALAAQINDRQGPRVWPRPTALRVKASRLLKAAGVSPSQPQP